MWGLNGKVDDLKELAMWRLGAEAALCVLTQREMHLQGSWAGQQPLESPGHCSWRQTLTNFYSIQMNVSRRARSLVTWAVSEKWGSFIQRWQDLESTRQLSSDLSNVIPEERAWVHEFRVQKGRFLFISGIKWPSNEKEFTCSSEFTVTESMQEEANDYPRRL